jgi:hypothetical protein
MADSFPVVGVKALADQRICNSVFSRPSSTLLIDASMVRNFPDPRHTFQLQVY